MNVVFFEVDGVLNFEGSEAKAPDNTMGIAESRVKLLKKLVEQDNSRLVLFGSWKKHWDFNDAKCTKNGVYLNKKLDRRGLHILDKTKDMDSVENEISDWLQRHPNVENHYVIKNGDVLDDTL